MRRHTKVVKQESEIEQISVFNLGASCDSGLAVLRISYHPGYNACDRVAKVYSVQYRVARVLQAMSALGLLSRHRLDYAL